MLPISRKQISYIRSLQQKKHREIHNQFVVEGTKNVHELLNSDFKIEHIYFTNDWNLQKEKDYNFSKISEKELRQISSLKNPDKVLAIVSKKNFILEGSELNQSLTLVLENINDPGNLGTIVRTADWFGVKNIICSKTSVDCYNPKVVQSSKGSLFRMNIYYLDLPVFFSKTTIPIYGTFLNGQNIYKSELKENAIIVMGSESHGISNEIEKLINYKITIPNFGTAESLNIGIATGIILSEFKRLK